MVGDLYGMQGKLNQALQQFQTWATREPALPVGRQTMVGLLLEKLHRMPEAQRTYERVLEMDRHAAIAANNLAWMLAEGGGNLDQATELAQTAKSQAPDQPAFNDTLGWIYYKKNLVERSAVLLFQQALEKDPENALNPFPSRHGIRQAGRGLESDCRAEARARPESTAEYRGRSTSHTRRPPNVVD